MWHEARKQEKMIRGMIVDYRRRAERRKDFYEKIKAEPTQFLQLHGRPCKIHLDPAIAAAGEGPAIMMPWQGDPNNMIDRFDVRAHLDYIPEVVNPEVLPDDMSTEERQCNYERYRILAQNSFLGISEDKFLQQLAIEELFGVTIEEKEQQKEKLNEKKGTGAAIGYNYNDPGAQPSSSNGPIPKKTEEKDSDDDSDLEVIDVDLSIDVNKMEPAQAHELNAVGPLFGMAGCDLFSFLTGDADDAEQQKQLLREEKEKAMFSGRKSRRERRAHRDKKLATRVVSPPSYAAPQERQRTPSRSPSRSPSPEAPENIEFITSFGGEDEEIKPSFPQKPLYAEKLKKNLKPVVRYADAVRKPRARAPSIENTYDVPIGPQGPPSRSRSKSRSRPLSRSRSRSYSMQRYKSRSRSRSVSRSRQRSRSYSRYSRSPSRSKYSYRRRSRSPANHSSYAKRRSRSKSNESNGNVSSKAPLPRYYGRRKEDKSSSELSVDSDSSESDNQKKPAVGFKPNNVSNQNQIRLSGSSSKIPSRETLSLKEKLRRKMQAQLSRQLRADKRAEAERQERECRRQARRDEEMRELALKLRRKQREMRHQQNRRSSDDGSDDSRTTSSSRESSHGKRRKSSRSRSRSRSPEKRIPVWDANKEPPSFRAKQEADSSSNRRRYGPENYTDKRREDERQFKYDRYTKDSRDTRDQREGNYRTSHFEPHYRDHQNDREERRDDKSFQKRPYGQSSRGGFRPSQRSDRDRNESNYEAESSSSRGRIRLVDY